MSNVPAKRIWICFALLASCLADRASNPPGAVFEADVQRLLNARCLRCHGAPDAAAEGGFRVDTYLNVLACPDSSPQLRAIDVGANGPPILAVLDRSDHADLLDAAERARLTSWVTQGAPLRHSAVHTSLLLNARTPDWHGKLAAPDHYGALLNADHPHVCGRCHAGAPVTPRGVRYPAAGAPACTTCHTQAEGVLACGTCHGDGASIAYPPRDACLFGPTEPDAHRAHLESTRLSDQRLQCGTCHPGADASLQDTHANGVVDVQFDTARAGADASYDATTAQCSVSCHNQHGARAMPSFHESGPLGCGDCHGAPPADHYAGTCDLCHTEANPDGSGLRSHKLHMNGKVDLGNGSGDCSACHGQGGDPMPLTPSHRLHHDTQLTAAITCGDCHQVPETPTSPGHLDTSQARARVVFGARATARGQAAEYAAGTCRNIACHGAGLPEGIERALVWDAPATGTCAGCHGLPPSKDHPADQGCASLICHGREVTLSTPPMITEAGRSAHINGQIDKGMP